MEPAKPRILFCVTTSDWGGVQHFVLAIAAAAQKNGHHVTVAAGGTGELGEKCRASGIPFIRLRHTQRPLSPIRDLAAIHELRQVIRDVAPNIIHLNSSKMGVLGAIAAHLERTPRVIYRIGGWAFEERLPEWKRWLYRETERWSAAKKDVIVTVHPGDEERAEQEGIRPRGRVVTIPNGIDLPSFDAALKSQEDARNILGIDPDAFVVGTVANYYPPKNLPWFLKTISSSGIGHPMSNWTSDVQKTNYVIIGDGPQHDGITKLHADLALGRSVLLAGRRTDASTLLAAFDVFALPSTKEGMPWTLLEAMAAGIPCVATDVGACRWMLQDGAGIIVPANDAAAFMGAIQRLRDDETLRKSIGGRGRAAIETRFTWETARDQTLRLFDF